MKREFAFLETAYGFQQYMKQRSGSCYYSAWTNEHIKIKVLYNDAVDKDIPVCSRSVRHTVSKEHGQLRMDQTPVLPPAGPFLRNIHHG